MEPIGSVQSDCKEQVYMRETLDKILTSSKMTSQCTSPMRVTANSFKLHHDSELNMQEASVLEVEGSPRDQDYNRKLIDFKKMRRENFDTSQFSEINRKAIYDKNALQDKMDLVNM